jgi:hypothetical protein
MRKQSWAYGEPDPDRARHLRTILVVLAAVLTIAPTAALADNLQSDLNTTTGGLDKTVNRGTLSPGSAYSQDVFLFVQLQPGATNDPTYPFNVTGSGNLGATFSGVTILGANTTNGQTGQVSWTTPTAQATAQNYTITVSFDANTTINESPATVNIQFSIPAAPSNTPPSVSVTGVGNGATYELGSVPAAGCSVTDAEDGPSTFAATVSAVSGPLSAYGLGSQTASCSYSDGGGLSASASATYSIVDTTAPVITFVGRTAPNGNGWNNGDVTVSWSCSDTPGSGVLNASISQTVSTEGANQSATGTCEDHAGNTASDTQSGINIDTTDPTVSLVGGPADGGTYYFAFVPAAPTCNASDALSGLDACSVNGYSNAVGSHTVTANAMDKAGNGSSASASFTVLAWTLNGFYQPVDMNGVFNSVKAGSTVPLKFEIFAGTTELTDASYVTSLKYGSVACDATSATDDIETLATGGTVLRYDSMGGQYVYNWKTPSTKGCWSVVVRTLDGGSISAFFKTK